VGITAEYNEIEIIKELLSVICRLHMIKTLFLTQEKDVPNTEYRCIK